MYQPLRATKEKDHKKHMAPIDTILNQVVESGDIPGVVAIAANESGIIYQGAAGKRGDVTAPAMTTDTVFRIASMTKAVASVAAMQLVERGELSLDEALETKVPQLAGRQVFDGFDADGKPRLRPAARPVSLRHLLTHTSGYCYEFWNAEFGQFAEQSSIPRFTDGGDGFLDSPLVFDPGQRWEYGISTDWVGRVVEHLSGQNLADYCREHIFQPLGMTDTSFSPTPDQRTRLVNVCQRQDDGSFEQIEFELPSDGRFFSGGGGLYATAGDYLAFLRMLLNGGTYQGSQVLKPETVALMGENHIGRLSVGAATSAVPFLSNDIEFFPGQDKKWGLGFLINTQALDTGRSAGSLSWAGLFNSYYWIDPHKKVTGLVMMQLLPFFDALALQVLDGFETQVYRQLGQG